MIPESDGQAKARDQGRKAASGSAGDGARGAWDRLGWMAALGGGLCGGLAFEPFGLRWLAPLAPLGLFLAALTAPRPKTAWIRGLAGGYLFYGMAISWLMTTGRYNGFAYLGVPILALYLALYPSFVSWAARRWFGQLGVMSQFGVFCGLWLLTEWFRTLGRLAMPFSQLGHAWAVWPSAIQSAEYLGEMGVSLQILLISATLLALMRVGASLTGSAHHRSGLWRKILRVDQTTPARAAGSLGGYVTLAFAMLAFSILRGQVWERRLADADPKNSIRVAALQPAIAQDVKMASTMDNDARVRETLTQEIIAIHRRLIAEEVPRDIDLLVMPESTFPQIDFQFDAHLHDAIATMMQPLRCDLLLGAVRLTLTADRNIDEVFNSVYFIAEGGGIDPARTQDKMRLVPFGEYLPYFDLIPGFQEGIVGIASFSEGRGIHLFQTKGRRHATLVCFESTFGAQARREVLKGAEFLTVVTNDAWYGRSAGAAQHHNLSLLRAVETRRPIVRSANTGISSIITPTGRVARTLALGKHGVVTGGIQPQSVITFYGRWGNRWLVSGILAFVILSAIRAGSLRRKGAAAEPSRS